MFRHTSRLTPLLVGIAILLADLTTKAYIYLHVPPMDRAPAHYPYGGIPLFKNFLGIELSITHATNLGAAWGMFSQWHAQLLLLRIAIIAGALIYTLFINKIPSRAIPLTLIIAGAIGNVLDHFIYGHVIDMIHFVFWGYSYPVFNLADSSIFIGIVWLFFLSWRENRTPCRSSQ